MASFIVQGGKLLEGELEVRGSKNAALAALASSPLFKNTIEFQNLADIEDVKRMRELMNSVLQTGSLDFDIAKMFRASILLVGPLLARFGSVSFPHPGGCLIGERPIDVFLDGWKKMYANIERDGEVYFLKAPDGLRGCDYTFRVSSVTGTEGLMMTAVLARGKTILRGAALEPEVLRLAEFLNRCGARITGAGTRTIIIEGRKGLLDAKYPFIVPPDRLEAGSFAILGSLCAKRLLIKNFPAEHLSSFLDTLLKVGVKFKYGAESHILTLERVLFGSGRAVHVKTAEYPGFPTDLQALFTVLATQAKGSSIINETIFDERLQYIHDLNRMGAEILLASSRRAIVNGPTQLRGSVLRSPDLRAGLVQ